MKKFRPLAGMDFKNLSKESVAFSRRNSKVPAQRMVDFTQNKSFKRHSKTSYVPGTLDKLGFFLDFNPNHA